MVAALVHPDVELWATGYLRSALAARSEAYAAGVFVGNAVPGTRRARMVIFRRDGGPRVDALRDVARLTAVVWGATEQEATDLARLVAALLWVAPRTGGVVRVETTSGPSPVPDESGQPQRLLSFQITTRGQ